MQQFSKKLSTIIACYACIALVATLIADSPSAMALTSFLSLFVTFIGLIVAAVNAPNSNGRNWGRAIIFASIIMLVLGFAVCTASVSI